MTDKVELSAELKAKAEEIQKSLQISDEGVVTVVDGQDPFKQTLDDDVTMADVKKVFKSIVNYTEASALAVGNLAIDHMQQHDTDKVTAKLPIYGYNNVTHQVTRRVSGPVPGSDGETWEKYGALNSSLNVSGTKAKQGGLSKVADYLGTEAAAKLSGK